MIPRYYGAFIPEGDDILLHAGKRAYFIGDAAGLNDAFSGGGIHYALLSAQALAAAFAGKASYEEAMKPHVEFVQKNSKKSKQYYAAAYSVISGFGNKR